MDHEISKAINYKRNAAKAFDSLLGILSGIKADGQITDGDVQFLHNWISEQEYIAGDPDVYDLFHLLNDILDDGVITSEEKEDLNNFLSDILEYRDEWGFQDAEQDAFIKRAVGYFSGLGADNNLTDEEVSSLTEFLDNSGELKNAWPISQVYKAVQTAIEDSYVSGAEKEFILLALNDVIGGNLQEDGIASGKTIKLPFDNAETLSFKNKSFCFTGNMVNLSRKDCEQEVLLRGGDFKRGVSKDLDFLVVGPSSGRDWIHTSFGRKIEKVIDYRKRYGSNIKIICEKDFVEGLN